MSAHAAGLLIDEATDNILPHKTFHRWSFRLPLTQAQIQALVSLLLLARESSYSMLDASVGSRDSCPRRRGDGHRRLDQRFYNDIELPKTGLLPSRNRAPDAVSRAFPSIQTPADSPLPRL